MPDTAILCRARRSRPASARTALPTGYLDVTRSRFLCRVAVALQLSKDAPPRSARVAVLHVVALLLVLEQTTDLPRWIYGAIVLLLATILARSLRLMVKGAMIGVLLKLGADKSADDWDDHGAAWG